MRRERATIRTVAGIRKSLGKIVIESMGGRLPSTKAIKLEIAACQGLVNSSYSIPYFSSTKALSGFFKNALLVKSWADVNKSKKVRNCCFRDKFEQFPSLFLYFQKCF